MGAPPLIIDILMEMKSQKVRPYLSLANPHRFIVMENILARKLESTMLMVLNEPRSLRGLPSLIS